MERVSSETTGKAARANGAIRTDRHGAAGRLFIVRRAENQKSPTLLRFRFSFEPEQGTE
jgi:hypothetical protein